MGRTPFTVTARRSARRPRFSWRVRAGFPLAALATALATAFPFPAAAQTPLQSPIGGAQSRPHDTAAAALKAGNPAAALDITQNALVTFPNDAQLKFLRAVALNQLQRYPEAEEAFNTLTQEYPELPEPYNNLAVVRAAQGKLDLARSALEQAIRAVPDYAIAHENLGDVYAQLAARSYRTAQQLAPANGALAGKLRVIAELTALPSGNARAGGGQPASSQTNPPGQPNRPSRP